MASGERRAVRAARSQATFRELNERIEEVNDSFDSIDGELSLVCECADASCTQAITMTRSEYERLRASPQRFAVVPGHVDPELERVVEVDERFEVVEKVGPGAEEAERLDSRRHGDEK
jgi:hypothetical protein